MLHSLCRTAVSFAIATLVALELLVASDIAVDAQPAEPVIVYQNVHEGDKLGEKPFVLQFCFQDPINIKDLDKGGDFRFELRNPQNMGLGLRIVFQPDGYGVAVYPGPEPSLIPGVVTPTGEPAWTYEWRVVDAEDGTPLEGTLRFTVDPDAEPIPLETPPPCVQAGGTATPGGLTASPSPTIRPTRTPVDQTPAPGETERPQETPEPGLDEADDGPDVLLLALLTVGVVGAAGGVGLIGFVLRKKIGFDPHKPGPGPGDGHH